MVARLNLRETLTETIWENDVSLKDHDDRLQHHQSTGANYCSTKGGQCDLWPVYCFYWL